MTVFRIAGLFFQLASVAWAQPAIDTLWSVYPGVNHSSEFFYEMLELEDGAMLFAGGLYSADSGRIIDAVYKQTVEGADIWSTAFHGIGLGWFKGICATEDGGCVLAGETRIPDQPGEQELYVARVDANGDSLWTRLFLRPQQDSFEAVYPAEGGGYWLFGQSRVTSFFDQFLMMRISEDGDSLESHFYGGPGQDYLWDAVPTSDGGFLMAGGYWDSSVGYNQGMLVKVDAGGDSLWGRLYGGGDDIDFQGAAVDPAGGFILCGTIEIGDAEADFFLMKVDENGDSLWSRQYGGEFGDFATCVVPVYRGYAIAGRTSSFGAGQSDAYIVRTDENGDSLFSQTFGGALTENVWDIVQTEDLSYVICGSGNLSGLGRDAWILKTTPDPTNIPPGAFDLLLPEPDVTIDWFETPSVECVWRSSLDRNGDEVTYLFHAEVVSGGIGLSQGDAELADTTFALNFEVPLDALDELSVIEWSVQATDGTDTVEAANGSRGFTLAHPGDANAGGIVPMEFSLSAYPNPFNPATTISFSLPRASEVALKVYDMTGRVVKSIADRPYHAGTHTIEFDGAALPSGVYFLRLHSADYRETAKLLLLK